MKSFTNPRFFCKGAVLFRTSFLRLPRKGRSRDAERGNPARLVAEWQVFPQYAGDGSLCAGGAPGGLV